MITLVIHGTFANAASWWQLGNNGESTFADQLEERLAAKGIRHTVWRPALDAGMTYDDFAWSGENRHKDRVAGARKIAGSLGELAKRLDASKDEPLEVNLVAHSHGGNVALEILKWLPDTVRARRMTMLGTPLVWRYASGRLYAIAGAIFFFAVTIGAFFAGAREEQAADPVTGVELWFVTILAILFLLLLLGPYLLLIERPFVWAERALSWLVSLVRRGGPSGLPVYGPRAAQLLELVDEPPTVITSREDEADLALHIGASPREVYGALVRGQLSGVMRFVEPLYIRGVLSVLVAPIAEAATEHFVLGFGWIKVMFNNYEMVDFEPDDGSYGGTAIHRLDVSEDLVPALIEKLSEWRPTAAMVAEQVEGQSEADRHVQALRSTILGVATDIGRQMQLRHTVYYETESVIDRVAGLVAS
ncbi:MAG: hypothetical protein U9N84_00560 [Actinomycetota bacterium]|nr:hypothetical protein [Actinomycetota bacterium]